MKNVKVSIITVCFNSENTIEKTIQSLLNQTYEDIEYIIVDGKSTDGTLQIIDKYKVRFGSRIKVISEHDNGIYDAMNKGIKMASGTLIGMINSDDYYECNAIENMVKALDSDTNTVLYGMQRFVRNGNEEKTVLYRHEFLDKQMIAHPSCFVTKDVYEKYGVFNLDYKSSADYEFMLRLFHNSNVVFKPVYKIISSFETGGMSSSEIGVKETARLRFERGIISKKTYQFIIIRSRIHEFKKRILGI